MTLVLNNEEIERVLSTDLCIDALQGIVDEADRVDFHTRAVVREQGFRPSVETATPQQQPGWWSNPEAPFRQRLLDLGTSPQVEHWAESAMTKSRCS